MSMVAFLVSFLASTAGAICGIGGGVIIKPVLDLFQMASVSTISFLSGCTVLSMSLYSVGRAAASRDSVVDFKTGTPLALGAALGGVLGKQLFTAVKEAASNPNMVGGRTGRLSDDHYNLHARLHCKQSEYQNTPGEGDRALRNNRHNTRYYVELLGNWRRTNQPGGFVLLLFDVHKGGGAEQLVHYFDFADYKRYDNIVHKNCSGI